MRIKLLRSAFLYASLILPFQVMAQKSKPLSINTGPVVNSRVIRDSDVYNRGLQEFNRTRDPALRTVPLERIIQARIIRDQLLQAPVAKRSKLQITHAATAGTQPSVSSITWTERGPTNVGGRTRALLFDLNDKANGYKKVFAGGVGGGIWYTTDITASTVTWNKINDFFDNISISCLIQNPLNPKIMYAGTGEGFGVMTKGLGVWKSIDGGTTWTRLPSTNSFSYITSILVDLNGNVYFSALSGGIQKSTDGGTTWIEVAGSPVIGASLDGEDLELAANGDLYACLGDAENGQIFLSDANNGVNTGNAGTWTNITPDVTGALTTLTTNWERIKIGCAPGDANTAYAIFEGGNSNVSSIQRYSKTTGKWTVKTIPPRTFANKQAWYAIAIAVDPNNANILFAGSLFQYWSTNGGATWATANSNVHVDHHTYTYAPGSSSRLLMGTDGGVYYTPSANVTSGAGPEFMNVNTGYNVTQFYSIALHPTSLNYALAGAQDNGSQQFSLPGLGTTSLASDGDGADTFIDQITPNVQITSYTYNDRFVSVDNGVTFNEVNFNTKGSFINASGYDSNIKTLYSGDAPGAYFRWNNVAAASTKDGLSIPVAGFNSANVTSVTISPITANRTYFGLDNGTIAVVDNANGSANTASIILTPNATPIGAYTSVSGIAIDPASENHILVTFSNYGAGTVYETQNAFASNPVWTLIQGNLPDMPVRWVMFYPGDATRSIIATQLGVWSTDLLKGTSTVWNPSNSGLANAQIDMLQFRASDRTLAAATYGRGMFTTTLPESSSQSSIPVPSIAAAGPLSFQTGGSVVMSTQPVSGYTNQWMQNGLVIPGATTASYTASTSGSYTVRLVQNEQFQTSSALVASLVFSLPATNFTLTNTSASCVGSLNGTIAVAAIQNQSYIATLTGNGLNISSPFTSSTSFTALAAGSYTVCMTLPSQPGYQECFTAVVAQPFDLSVYTAYDKTSKVLSVDLTGADTYLINLNGIQSATTQNHLDLALAKGTNVLTVSTGKLCQGTVTRKMRVTEEEQVFPNPFSSVLNIDLGPAMLPVADITIYSLDGSQVYASHSVNRSGIVQLNLPVLNAGVYLLKLNTGSEERSFKIIRK